MSAGDRSTVARAVNRVRRGRDQLRARGRFWQTAREYTRHVSVELDGVRYVVSTVDAGVGHDIFVNAHRPELIVLPRAVSLLPQAGGTFVDVGANVGTTSIPAVTRHGFDRAVAIEPGPESALLLRANCLLNGADDRVTVVAAAAGDEEGTVLLDVSAPNPGAYGVVREGAASGPVEPIPVDQVTLDGLAARGVFDPAHVGLLWVDAQGYEAHVLAGAAEVLRHAPPVVVAVRPKKLIRAGRADAFLDTLEQTYAHAVDLRAPSLRLPVWRPEIAAISWLRELFATGRVTDVLVYND